MKQNPLLDFNFLYELDQNHNRVTFARITSLTPDNYPCERIEGVVSSGNINLDGNSTVRRVCQLTIITNNLNLNNIYWSLTTRIKIEIGIQNNLLNYSKYPDIIWFPQGIYILTDFKTSAKVNQYEISITGKDKMCLLNGDIGGVFNAETQLDIERIVDEDGNYVDEKRPISYIIREMIHYYGQENFHNIVIKDIDTLSVEMLTNNSGKDFFLIQNVDTEEFVDICSGVALLTQKNYYYKDTPGLLVNFNNLSSDFIFKTNTDEDNSTLITQNISPTYLTDEHNENTYVVIKIEDGEDIGYQLTETYYPEDLIAAVGETVTSILDKIIKVFGAFEYFYNTEGQFIFQAKQTYVNTSWNNMIKIENENFIEPYKVAHSVKYSFEGSRTTTAYQNSPQLGKIKNDFTVWGKRKTTSGQEIPIHMRYAIDKKPDFYYSYTDQGYFSEDFFNNIVKDKYIYDIDELNSQIIINNEYYKIVDWREIIYQMAKDYLQHNHDDDFEVNIQKRNLKTFILRDSQLSITMKPYERGRTGYEQYYHDIEGFWRTLYLPEEELDTVKTIDTKNIQIINKDDFYKISSSLDGSFYIKEYCGPWNKNIFENPSSLLFWLDFFDAESLGLGQFSIPAIGDRPKNENNDNVRAIIYKDVPDVIFILKEKYNEYSDKGRLLDGYSYLIVSDLLKNYLDDGRISISTRSITAQEIIDNLIYNNAYCNETITLQSIPIYYLQPNTIISARDEERGVNGYYIINKISLPLNYSNDMKITAIKVPERIY